MDIDYRPAWAQIASGAAPPQPSDNHGGGDVLLTSKWHQDWPYNRYCPGDDDCVHCLVGCVATAGAQMLRYWAWPPGYGDHTYSYIDMPDDAGSWSTTQEILAVARICSDFGEAIGMDYGCDGSSAMAWKEDGTFKADFHYCDCSREHRSDYDVAGWYSKIRSQIRQNRPIMYNIPDHTIVCDGYDIVGGTYEYHINYGWSGEQHSSWYAIDTIYGGDPGSEDALCYVRPNMSVGSTLVGDYGLISYIDQDTSGSNVNFMPGQLIQWLPGTTMTGAGDAGVCIQATAGAPTHLYARGDTTVGAVINSGGIKMTNGGSITFNGVKPYWVGGGFGYAAPSVSR
jgi:hypothetical protein